MCQRRYRANHQQKKDENPNYIPPGRPRKQAICHHCRAVFENDYTRRVLFAGNCSVQCWDAEKKKQNDAITQDLLQRALASAPQGPITYTEEEVANNKALREMGADIPDISQPQHLGEPKPVPAQETSTFREVVDMAFLSGLPEGASVAGMQPAFSTAC